MQNVNESIIEGIGLFYLIVYLIHQHHPFCDLNSHTLEKYMVSAEYRGKVHDQNIYSNNRDPSKLAEVKTA